MKKFIVIAILLGMIGISYADTNTSYLGLNRPARGAANWDTKINTNFTLIDNEFVARVAYDEWLYQQILLKYGDLVARLGNLPEMYVDTGTFNGTTGTTITLPKTVDAINEYAVAVVATSRGAAVGDIYVEQTITNFVVRCSSPNTGDTFKALIVYREDVNPYGTAIHRKWFVTPSDSITDQCNSATSGSLAWVVDQIDGYYADVELPGNHVYTIDQDCTIPETIHLIFQQGAVLTKGASSTSLTINGPMSGPPTQRFDDDSVGDTWVTIGGNSTSEIYADFWTEDGAGIMAAWNAITKGTVLCRPGKTYLGDVTLSEATNPKTLNGQDAIITGNLIVNKSKDIVVKNLYVDGYGEINGCWRCEWENITFEEGGGKFSGTNRYGHSITITDSPDDGDTGYGTWWTTLRRVNAHGAILAPGAYNLSSATRSNSGINLLRFVECNIKSALTDGSGDMHDPDNASIRIVPTLGLDKTHNTQNNHFIGGDLSDSQYLVKNENSYEFYVDQSYCEQYESTHTGKVEFANASYVYTSRKTSGYDDTMGPGDNDTKFTYDEIHTTANRGSTGGALFPATDVYGNPHLMFLEYNTVGAAWLPKGITGGAGIYNQCGNSTTDPADNSTMALYADTAIDSGNLHNMVLKVTGPTVGTCAVRFLADEQSNIDGHLAAVVVMRGNFNGSKIGFNGCEGTENILHGSQSDDKYEIFFGTSSKSIDDSACKPYVEVQVGAGQTAYIAQVMLGRGKTMTAQSSYIPTRREAISGSGEPASGIWWSKDLVWNINGGAATVGEPIGWLCTVAGDFAGTPPTFQELGQIGIRSLAITTPVGATASRKVGELLLTTTGDNRAWISYGAVGSTTWIQLGGSAP
jgi:hypothetical protein